MNRDDQELKNTDEAIAIIAMAGRFPGAESIAQFWQNLESGIESVSFFSDEELRASGIDAAVIEDPNYIKAGAILNDSESFDARLFGFSPREAELLDPQHRLFLECAWEALETAGYDSQTYKGLIGVYAGAGMSRYLLYNLLSNRDSIDEFQARLGADKDFVPTRLSYKLNLKGPSINVQTACSTSLVAIHLACQSLLNGECDMALAGGVSIKVPQKVGYFYQENGVVSGDGHCRAFDAKAQGFVPGSGAGIVLLKRLDEALRDKDRIEAVIKGSAINNDGASKIGYTAPSVDGQAEVISEALAMAGVDAETITYIETHGTATTIGDPIEVRALTRAFQAQTKKRGFCAIGSLKSNIGHLDTAAGVAGLIKTALALKHKLIPPSLHFEQPNPEIDFENSPFYVNTKPTEWRTDGHPRRAGVSSFGLGGTNAHVILEEAPSANASGESRPLQLLVLSAKTDSALETSTANMVSYLKQRPDTNLADAAYTLQVGRRALDHRRMLVCSELEDAVKSLAQLDPQRVLTAECQPGERRVTFMFPGGGTQYPNMGLDLYRTEQTFKDCVDECSELLKPNVGYELRDYLYPAADRVEEVAERLNRTPVALPALFVVEYALAKLWISWGIEPEAMIGHSLGEYVAACLSGVVSLEDALSLVVARAGLIDGLPKGAMLSVMMSESEVQGLIDGKLSIAAVNGPSQCVVSGPSGAIEEAALSLTAKGVEHRRLPIEAAGHSMMIDEILEPFGDVVAGLRFKAPDIPFISNVTGAWITPSEAKDPRYWVRHLRQTVRFNQGIQQLFQNPNRILLEVGPGNTLSTLARKNPYKNAAHVVLSSMRHPKDQQSDLALLLNTLGKLWLEGVQVDWPGFYARERRRRISLPTYPFERRRYWIDPAEQANRMHPPQPSMSKKPDISDWFYAPVWRESVPQPPARSEDHAKQGSCWLVFRDRCSLGSRMVEMLGQQGHDVVAVIPGERFGKILDRLYSVNPQRRDDYEAVLEELQSLGKTPRNIVHLWGLSPDYEASEDMDSVERSQGLGFYSLFLLAQALGEKVFAQALGRQAALDTVRIAVVTNHLHDITGQERLLPGKATVLGPCRVIPQEYPNVTCKSIDIALPEPGRKDEVINQLLAELESRSSDPVIAYRGSHRWVQSFEPVRLEHSAGSRLRLQKGGVYLITGGLGGVGLELAHYLAQAARARLILVTHSQFPARDEWGNWLATHPEGDRVSRQIEKIQEIEDLGADVLVGKADLADAEQVRALIDEAQKQFGPINGVIHSAGVRPEGIIQQKTIEEAASILAPKVRGTLLLSALLDGQELDFFALCSSLRAIVGGAGMVDHAAANAFLDAFARCRSLSGDPIISINWDSWGEVGQSIIPSGRPASEQRLKARMSNIEGVDAFTRALSSPMPQVIVSIQDIQAAIDFYNGKVADRDKEELEVSRPPGSVHSRPQLRTAYVAPRDEVEQTLAEIWQELLGIEKVGIYDNFFELGGDSVMGIRIIARSNQAGLRLTPRRVFEHQTIAELALVAEKVQAIESEDGPVIGQVPLTPIQRWFFERNPEDPHLFTLAMLLEFQQEMSHALLERAISEVLSHHDALRLRFFREEHEWRQFNAGPDQAVPFRRINLSGLSEPEQESAIETRAVESEESLNLSEGPLIRFDLFELGPHRPSRLLVIINHLAVDARSWRILVEDLETAYRQLSRGEPVNLGPRMTSFRQWACKLVEYARSEDLRKELPYWISEPRLRAARLPLDFPEGVNDEASVSHISVWLSEEETDDLLHEVPRAYQVEIDDVLLTALAQGFAQWTGQSAHLFDLENDGRESLFTDIDLSRTVGWFTTMMPILLEVRESSSPGEALKSVKEQLRRIPSQGIGYGLLRYVSGDRGIQEQLAGLPKAEVSFLYLGQVAEGLSASSMSRPVENFKGRSRSVGATRSHLLQVSGRVIRGQLCMTWTYSESIHRYETILGLAEEFIATLRSLIKHCLASETLGYTPSDFPDVNLSQGELDDIVSRISGLGE